MTKTMIRSSVPLVFSRPADMTARFGGALAMVWRRFRARHATKALLELDDRQLHDIGLSRGDVYEALGAEGAADAVLSARAARHRRDELARMRSRRT